MPGRGRGRASASRRPRRPRSRARSRRGRAARPRARGAEGARRRAGRHPDRPQITLTPNFGRNGSTVVGYTATNSVTATLRNLDTAGAIVAAAAAAGANDIGGLTLTVSDQNAVYQRALKAAVADARAHAEAIAEASGETLGDLRSATEGSGNTPIPFQAEAKAADARDADRAGHARDHGRRHGHVRRRLTARRDGPLGQRDVVDVPRSAVGSDHDVAGGALVLAGAALDRDDERLPDRRALGDRR